MCASPETGPVTVASRNDLTSLAQVADRPVKPCIIRRIPPACRLTFGQAIYTLNGGTCLFESRRRLGRRGVVPVEVTYPGMTSGLGNNQ